MIPDNYSAYEAYDRKPRGITCCCCECELNETFAYKIDDEYYCERCMEDEFKIYVRDEDDL